MIMATAAVVCALTGGLNDAFTTSVGDAINYGKSANVQMLSEIVRLNLHDEYSDVRVDFVFANHGHAQTVTMAFPDRGYNVSGPVIKNFRSWVDGRQVATAYKQIASAEDEEFDHEGVWIKRVPFRSGETKKVRVTYRAENGGSVLKDAFASYILTTGATWHGRIKSTKVIVDWSGLRKLERPLIEAYRKNSDKDIRLNWRRSGSHSSTLLLMNFVPTFDIRFRMLPGFYRFLINGKPAARFNGYSYPVGSKSDLVFPVESFPALFAGYDRARDYMRDWANLATAKFGGSFALDGDSHLLIAGKRRVALARPAAMRAGINILRKNEQVKTVYLKDVVRALGGSYKYNAREDRVELDF